MEETAVATSPFPPSFDGNPWTYGFALFSLTLISAVSLTILVGYALEARGRRQFNQATGNYVEQPPFPFMHPLQLHRLIVSGFLLTIFMGAFPDVLIMLAWGEASARTMTNLYVLDRLGDGFLIIPFLCSVTLIVSAGQLVDHLLGNRADVAASSIKLRVSWVRLRERLKMASVVLLIAVGVTLAKSVR